MSKLLIGISVLSLVICAFGCQMITSGDLQPGVTAISLNKTTDTINGTASDTLVPAFLPYTASNKAVTWSSSNASIATVSASGVVTGVLPGTATITVTSADQNKAASCAVTVTLVTVTGVSLNKTTDSMSGTETLVATVIPSNATNKNVVWTSSNNAVATVSSSGTVTSQAPGTTTITATTVDQNIPATCSLTVPNVLVTGVSLNKSSDAISNTDTLIATVAPANATNQNVIWSTSNPAIATVSATGVVTAVSSGSATVMVTTVDQGKTATCAVTITIVHVTGVTVNKTTDTISGTGTDTLTATIVPANATNQNVTWSSSNQAIATVSSAGVVIGVSPGQATVTVTTVDGNMTANCTITVSKISVTGISINKTADNIPIYGTDTLIATISPSTATNQNVTWVSSNSSIATVSSSGVITGIALGTATITATTADQGLTAICLVTVSPNTVTGVSLNKTIDTINVGGTDTLIDAITPSFATNQNVSWSSSNTSVATVSTSGVVTGVAVGTATITVTTVDQAKTATCSVTVVQLVTGVSLNKTNDTIDMPTPGTDTLIATIQPTNATNQTVTWSSSNSSIATVSSSGVVTAIAPGTATITVTTADQGKTASCTVTVVQLVTVVSLNKSTDTINGTGTDTLTATVLPTNAKNQSVTWTSSNSAIATVSSSGIVTGVTAGQVTITVTTVDQGKTANCLVTIVNVPVTGVSLNKTNDSIDSGNTDTFTATIAPTNANNKNIVWTTSSTSIATISSSGVVTGISAGTVTITATTVDQGKTASCLLTVNVPVSGVNLSKGTDSINVGGTDTIIATILPSNAYNKNVTWVSSNTAVATVSTSGVITSIGYGTATITVTSIDQGKTANCIVTAQYIIGQTGPGGGLICYDSVVATGSTFMENGVTCRYLEAAPTDQSSGVAWWNGTDTNIPGAISTTIGSGKANTNAIIGVQGYGNYAAEVCTNYTGGGKNDWFLPSQSELNTMYSNLYVKNLGSFSSKIYWSSSQVSLNSAWSLVFSIDNPFAETTAGGLYVRAIRAF